MFQIPSYLKTATLVLSLAAVPSGFAQTVTDWDFAGVTAETTTLNATTLGSGVGSASMQLGTSSPEGVSYPSSVGDQFGVERQTATAPNRSLAVSAGLFIDVFLTAQAGQTFSLGALDVYLSTEKFTGVEIYASPTATFPTGAGTLLASATGLSTGGTVPDIFPATIPVTDSSFQDITQASLRIVGIASNTGNNTKLLYFSNRPSTTSGFATAAPEISSVATLAALMLVSLVRTRRR